MTSNMTNNGILTRAHVDGALITAGEQPEVNDSDIQRLTNLQIEMSFAGQRTVDVDVLDSDTRLLLLHLVRKAPLLN